MNTPSLPQRLANRVFHPMIWVGLSFFLLSIWATYSIVLDITAVVIKDLTATSAVEQNSSSVTTTSFPTQHNFTETITTTIKSTPTNIVPTINRTQLTQVIKNYMSEKIIQSETNITSIIDNNVPKFLFEDFNNWHDNILRELSSQNNSISNLQNGILEEINSQAANLNSSLEQLSESGFILNNENFSLENLTIDTTKFSNLFKNAKIQIEDTSNFWLKQNISLNLTENGTSFLNLNVSSFTELGILDSLKRNLTNLFSAGKEGSNNVSKKILFRRDIGNTLDSGYNSKTLLKRCKILSGVFTFVFSIAIICCLMYEWVKFRFEQKVFNTEFAQLLECTEGKEEEINIQITLREKMKFVINALDNIFVYYLSKWRDVTPLNSRPRKQHFLTKMGWWFFTNGRYLWIFFIMIIIYFQVVLSLTKTTLNTIESSTSFELLEKRSLSTITTQTEVLTKKMTSFSQICKNFESSFNDILKTAIDDQLWSAKKGKLTSVIENINTQVSQMIFEYENMTSLELPSWEPITQEVASKWVPLDLNSTSDTGLLDLILSNNAIIMSAEPEPVLQKRSVEKYKVKMSLAVKLRKLRKYTIIGMCIVLFVHFGVGIIMACSVGN
ncbi:hypothetical protein NCAS_0A13340 [Naumovozyma castellii]|uniref:Uncharacterized protein n=1 Tax=Naumovozyma castellii TaxID=27288 RepID=G0V8U3_NAUCA|nr:hypothetical protein NCAS_0A13340 [Naumovozyma castellii CBS 4309]CCC67892.1 hypothetical protein NCAS_0A13340 [Naumovozyma castellii CBS 4309]